MTNNMHCPNCGESQRFAVAAECRVIVTSIRDQSRTMELVPGTMNFDADAECICLECGFGDAASEFIEYK